MGRQFSLFLIGDDEVVIWRALTEVGPFSVYRRDSPATLRSITAAYAPLLAERSLAFAPQGFVARISQDYVRTVRTYVLDTWDSEVIEFTRPRLIDRKTEWGPAPTKPWIEQGRLWFDPWGSYGEPKSREFVKWADAVFKTVKKNLAHVGLMQYIGPTAKAAVDAGRISLRRPMPSRGAARVGKHHTSTRNFGTLGELQQMQRGWISRMVADGLPKAEIAQRLRSHLIDSGWPLDSRQLPPFVQRMLDKAFK